MAAHPAFAGAHALPSVSAHFIANHPAFSKQRSTCETVPLRHGYVVGEESQLILSAEWAEKLRATYVRVAKPSPSSRRRERQKRQQHKKKNASFLSTKVIARSHDTSS